MLSLESSLPIPRLDEIIHIKGRSLHLAPTFLPILLTSSDLRLIPSFPTLPLNNISI